MDTLNQNVTGEKVNGREIRKPDLKLTQKIFKAQNKSPLGFASGGRGSQSKILIDEDQERDAKEMTET